MSRKGRVRRFCYLLLLGLWIAGCSSSVHKLNKAQRLQSAGQYAAAVREYAAVLAQLPEDKAQAISLVSLHIAECQWAMGEPQAALLSLQNSLANDPENRYAHLRSAEFALAAGSPQSAMEHVRWILTREPDNADALATLGGIYAAVGEIAHAQTVFEQVLDRDPGRVDVSLTLAQIYAALGDSPKARSVLLRASGVRSSGAAPWLALGRLEEAAGNNVAAEESYRKAVASSDDEQAKLRLAEFLARASRIPEAEQVLAQIDRERPRTSTFRADFELLLGRGLEAIKGYTSLLNQPPANSGMALAGRNSNKSALTRASVIARLIEAELALSNEETQHANRLQPAKALFEQYRAELDEATAESLQAEMALVSGDLQLAETHALRAVELAPQSAATHFIAGLIKHAARDVPAANGYWNTALEKDPDFLPARQAVAARALTTGDAEAAEQYILPVVRQEPANFEALCIYSRALAAQRKNVPAVLIARRALAADNNAAEPHLILGNIAMQEKRWSLAFIEYQQAILLDSDSAEAMASLARIYRQGKITRPLLEQMERVAGNPPASASLMEIVGRLYADRGWHRDAERALRNATSIDPARTTAATALALTYAQDGRERAAADSLALTGASAAHLIAGLRATREKDVLSAIQSYESAVRGGDRSGTAANNLAWIYAQRGTELDRALELAHFARRLAPQDPAVLDTVGFVQLRRREYSGAVETFKQALELAQSPAGKHMPAHALREVKLHLAEAYLLSGQSEAAAAIKNSMR